jgi:CubicO group peptidase (beta-lactamase class C family)
MRGLAKSISSEWLKRKGSSVSWLALAGGFFVPVIMLVARLIYRSHTVIDNSSDGAWMRIFNQCWQFMAVFLLPMGITLAASLITQIEFRNKTWKLVGASPQSFSNIFWGKYIVVFIVLLQVFIYINVGILLCGVVPALIYPDVPFPKEALPIFDFLALNAKFFIRCLPVLALQYLLSLHIRNFILPVAIGISLVIGTLMAASWEYIYLIPYAYAPMDYLNNDFKVNPDININAWAICYFLFFTFLNYVLFLLKNQSSLRVNLALLNKRGALFVLFLIIFGGVFALASKRDDETKYKMPLPEAAQVNESIRQVEQNLGAFILSGLDTNDWNITARMRAHHVNGLSVAVVNNYRVEWTKSYGLADAMTPVKEQTRFLPGSLSKSLNAMALLRLVYQKRLGLFEDINTYLVTWKFPYDSLSKGKKITLYHLLSHSAGLSVHGFAGYGPGDTLPSLLQILDGKKPASSEPVRSLFEPGRKMQYSGGGIMISQQILEDITGLPYEVFMRDSILRPLGMLNSTFSQGIGPAPALYASGYDTVGNIMKGRCPILPEQAAAGLWTTPQDLCRFIIEMQLALCGRSQKIIPKELAQLMITPYLDKTTGMGAFVNHFGNHTYFSHEAANRGFSGAYYASAEDGKAVVVFMNAEANELIHEISQQVMEVYNWKGITRKEHRKIVPVDHRVTDRYVGHYAGGNRDGTADTVRIKKEGNKYWYITKDRSREIYFTSEIEFITPDFPTSKTILMDNHSNVEGILVKGLGRERKFKRTDGI